MAKRLLTRPITINEANNFVRTYHRHHRPTQRNCGKWAISAIDFLTDEVVGVAICANPVSATYMDGYTLEITRLCTNENAPLGTGSFLLSNCSKIWRTMGGKRILTYTLDYESGASLKGAGWTQTGVVRPHNNWNNKTNMDGKVRDELKIYQYKKFRWELQLIPEQKRAIQYS